MESNLGLGDNVIPTILQTNATDENQSIRVESVILDADNHSWTANQFGHTRFVITKKGTALSPDGRLIFKAKWTAHNIATDRSATFPRFQGGLSVLQNARLYIGGKLISETREVGKRIMLENCFETYDAQAEVLDVNLSGNHNYSYSPTGYAVLETDIRMGKKGTREIWANNVYNQEVAVPLAQLFPVLKDTLIPSSIRGQMIIEFDWDGVFNNCIVEGGDVAFTDTERVFEIFNPRLHLDFISYADEVANSLEAQINSQEGLTIPYRQSVLVSSLLPANPSNITQTTDIELGFSNRSVMKIYGQLLNSAESNALLRNGRSDGQNQQVVQLVVNNKTMYDRQVEKISEMYSYLNQTAERNFNCPPASYGEVGDLQTFVKDVNTYQYTYGSCSLNTTPKAIAGVQNDLQGRFRFLGFNLTRQRGGNDVPSNSVKVGEAPMIVRITRSGANGGTNEKENNTRTQSAVNVNMWVEAVKVLVVRNGVVDTLEV